MSKVFKCVTNLGVKGMKAPLQVSRHVQGITSGMPDARGKLQLSFNTSKGGQGSVHNMVLQDTVELRGSLACAWLRPFISVVGKTQLFMHVLSNPTIL